MSIEKIDADLLAKMFLAGAANLDAKKEWINELNVFPVPDGDTGTNMTMTILSAAKEVRGLDFPDMKALSKAVSSGSLRGARGNSGVILSQLLRGFTKVIENYDKIDNVVIAEACEKAVETAYKAVMKPKEGTILTVAKGIADKAITMVEETDDLEVLIGALIEEGNSVLKRTPEMLPVLKQAGVVDSGGQGLMVVLEGAYDVLMGKEVDYSAFEKPESQSGIVKISEETEADIKFGYCTEFIIVLKRPLTDDEIINYKAFLNSIGDSIVVVADDEIVKTHVHTNDPGLAMQEALTKGSLTKIKVDNMREEHEERLIANASKIAAEEKAKEEAAKANKELKDMGFISISAGEGLTDIFKDLGVDKVIEGGQTMNPSTEDILNAINEVDAKNIFVLPNNKNIILAANQAAELVEDKNIIVIPTKTIPQGVAALVSFVPEASAEENKDEMTEAISQVKSGEITYAVRDTTIDDKEIKENDFMAIGDNGLIAVGKDRDEVLKEMLANLIDDESGIVSIYYGDSVDEETAGTVADEIMELYPDIEVELNLGGQPVYSYIVSVE